ncbi:MAG TPA: DUF1552 domain-containing protein [Planctomycetota bacterium]|nr:DUF1552 domain-containing protein [Planctomycetota bacterium]
MTLSRRSVLRGAGAMMALPFMESLFSARAYGGEAKKAGPPLRMGIFTVTGGTVLESWRMKQPGPLTKLPSILRPLEFAKDDLLLLTGLAQHGKGEGVNGHEHCAFLHLTGADSVRKINGKVTAGKSVDQAAAEAVGEDSYLPSIEIGLSNHETKYSYRSADTPVPYEANPRLVFERMFRGRKLIVPDWNRRHAAMAQAVQQTARTDSYDRSVIDLVLEDAKSLRGKLGKADQIKLDEYLHSVRSVEKRISFIEARQYQEYLEAQAGAKTLDAPKNLPPEGTPIYKITQPVERDPERHAEYIRTMSDLMVLAFQTDTTRVVTLAVGSDEASFPGVVTVGYERHCHTLEHQGNAGRVQDADPIAREACRQIHAWYTQLFAEMIRKMKAIDEGGSSLLDNSMILYTSYMADGGHGRTDYPALLCGKAGGTIKPGRQVSYKDKTPMANLYVEMLDRMGAKVDSFGNSKTSKEAQYDGRLPDLV